MRPSRNRRRVFVLTAAVAAAAACSSGSPAPTRTQAVARRGAEVMPFDLGRTTHVFDPGPRGGVQTVVADDPRDRGQVALIREHLGEEAGRFARGDFGDPERIHGHDMLGLATLRARYASVSVEFSAAPRGAVIRYRSEDPAVVDALHRWFEAQLADHGEHAHRGT